MGWTHERARVASLSRSRTPDDPELLAARHALQLARAEDCVRKLAAELPDDDRRQLAAILHGPVAS